MKNGYYLELDALLEQDKDSTFGFLENISYSSEMNAYNYLHGYCDDFAMALSEAFGYKIETVHNGDGKLIHAYCVDIIDSTPVYIDIRGITSDPGLFYEEFENELTYLTGEIIVYDEEGYEVEGKTNIYSSALDYLENGPGLAIGDIKISDMLADANEFIAYNKQYYDICLFNSIISTKNILTTSILSQSNIKQPLFEQILSASRTNKSSVSNFSHLNKDVIEH